MPIAFYTYLTERNLPATWPYAEIPVMDKKGLIDVFTLYGLLLIMGGAVGYAFF